VPGVIRVIFHNNECLFCMHCAVCRRFHECLWGSERKVAEVDTQGVEDPKLFVWPGKGVYAVFGRKPEALGASPYCKDPIFVQFVVQVWKSIPFAGMPPQLDHQHCSTVVEISLKLLQCLWFVGMG